MKQLIVNLFINLLYTFIALLLSLFSIILTISLGAGTSVIGTFLPSNTFGSNVLTGISSAIPSILIAFLTYYFFIKTRFKKTWLVFFYTLPMQLFWLFYFYTSSKNVANIFSQVLNFLIPMIVCVLITIKKYKTVNKF